MVCLPRLHPVAPYLIDRLPDRLLNNPYVEPPQPKDWEVHPTHPVHNVPYYHAPLWDAGLSGHQTERNANAEKAKASTRKVSKKPTELDIFPSEI